LSSESGLIVSGYDIAGCISLLPISYLGKLDKAACIWRFKIFIIPQMILCSKWKFIFLSHFLGGRGHKPRWIGWGLVSASVGSFVLALPHFLSGPYEYKINSNNGASEPNSIAVSIFFYLIKSS